MRNTVLLICLLFVLTGCKKDNDKNLSGLNGTWQLDSYQVAYFDASGKKLYSDKPLVYNNYQYLKLQDDSLTISMDNIKPGKTLAGVSGEDTHTLPVNLTAFTAVIKNSRVEINWATSSEAVNSHFTIERSSDGKDFVTIGEIMGNGNSDVIHAYTFYDSYPCLGGNYYRLSQTDFNGVTTNLGIRAIVIGGIRMPINRDADKDYFNYTIGDFFNIEINTKSGTILSIYAKANGVKYNDGSGDKTAAYAELHMSYKPL
ncbi:hypothetical protein FW774_15390 [Pedobacter sp. BS3]|uniref:hypothetical protein n=1 Tax=Pedobacter sp. BS3 TaxID=2567937 RepID=UPI0011ED65F7|nr:hypothetical protein [Pedobacter sp. BS3]TZF82076.1 hypothetical protein FW774_15390 [Pedobacter sp. BS3]